MDLQPTLENELVSIRPMENGDLEALYRAAKDPAIWEQHHSNRHLKAEFKTFFAESIKSNGALVILDKQTGEIIGSSRFKSFDEFSNQVEIGWTFLSRKYWGGKYNMSVKNLMIGHAFKYADYVIFFVNKHNLRSQKAIEKIGGAQIQESEYWKYPKTSIDSLTFVIKRKPT
ncbi:MAG: GNAT family N-acetyltransferase [Cyclobacteriaceae bacterium]